MHVQRTSLCLYYNNRDKLIIKLTYCQIVKYNYNNNNNNKKISDHNKIIRIQKTTKNINMIKYMKIIQEIKDIHNIMNNQHNNNNKK